MKQFCFDERWYKVSWLLPRHALSWLADSCWGSWAPRAQQRNKLRHFLFTLRKFSFLHEQMTSQSSCVFIGCDEWADRRHLSQPRFCLTSPNRDCKQPSQLRVCSASTSCFLLPASCFLLPLMHGWCSWKVPAVETFNMDVVKRRKRLVWFLWWNIISVAAVRHFQPLLAPSFSF